MAYRMQRRAEWDQGKTQIRLLYGEMATTKGSTREICNGALSPRISNVSLWRYSTILSAEMTIWKREQEPSWYCTGKMNLPFTKTDERRDVFT